MKPTPGTKWETSTGKRPDWKAEGDVSSGQSPSSHMAACNPDISRSFFQGRESKVFCTLQFSNFADPIVENAAVPPAVVSWPVPPNAALEASDILS
jgi:hypothetical protein